MRTSHTSKATQPHVRGRNDKGQAMKLGQRIIAVCLSVLLATQMNPQAAIAFAETVRTANDANAAEPAGQDAAQGEAGESGASATNGASDGELDSGSEGVTSADNSEDAADGSDDAADKSEEVAGNSKSAANGADEAANAAEPESDETDDASSASVAAQDASYEITTIEELKQALNKTGDNVKVEDGKVTQLREVSPSDMILLSNSDPALYKTANISFSTTGDFSLTGEADYNGKKLTYQGLGSKNVPFEGTLGNNTFILKRALFAGYKANGDNPPFSLRFAGNEQSGNLFADCVDGNSKIVNVTVAFASGGTSNPTVVTAPLMGEIQGNLTANVTYALPGGTGGQFNQSVNITTDENAGMIARTVSNGATLKVASLSGLNPSSDSQYNVQSSKENAGAGLLVGELESGASFETCGLGNQGGTGFSKIAPSGTITANAGSAGGLVGKTGDNASIKITADEIDLTNLTIAGKTSGGFIGSASKVNLNDAFLGKLTLPKVVGSDAITEIAGGFIGRGSISSDFAFPDGENIAFPSEFTFNGKGGDKNSLYAGGLFGLLNLEANLTYENRDDLNSALGSQLLPDGKQQYTNYGGFAGKVLLSASAAKKLTIQNATIESKGASEGKHYYYGGLVGWVGQGQTGNLARTAFVVDSVTAKVSNTYPSARSFGGAVGCADGTATIDLGSFTLNTTNDAEIMPNQGGQNCFAGGIVGEAWDGSIIRLSGTTDLTKAKFGDGVRVGQLIGSRVNSLIYAEGNGQDAAPGSNTGWTLNRGDVVGIDDIASYGEVLRITQANSLSGLLSLDNATYNVTIDKPLINADSLTVNNAKDFAKLAITFQTNGYFSGVKGINKNNIATLYAKSINLTGDVDLSGTGLGGLTRDQYSVKWGGETRSYTGSINGNNHTLTLAIGEPYGKRNGENIQTSDTSEGNGKIYRHDRLGLLASTTGNAEDINLAGSMRFTAKAQISAGAVAARLAAGATASLSSVESSVAVTCASDGSNIAYVGGFYGVVDGEIRAAGNTVSAPSALLTFSSGNKATVNVTVSAKPQKILYGGAIGQIEASSTGSVTVNTNGLEIAGTFTAQGMTDDKNNADTTNSIAAGGFIGAIYGSYGSKETVNLLGLKFNGLTLSYPAAGSVGGLLGYMWANAEVTFSNGGLTTTETNILQPQNNAHILRAGGLVYRASGKWTVDNGGIDLSNYTVNNVTDTLGLLVCRGGANKENIADNSTRTEGLYLEVTAAWDTAYKLNESICGGSPKNFDEWVASTVDITGDSGSTNNILASGYNGVVSLRTDNGVVNMNGSSRNTYSNRTTYGKTKQKNVNTRYYYNLDVIKSDINSDADHKDGEINTAQELMIWSLIKYADPVLKSYFYTNEGTDCAASSSAMEEITGTLDMVNYSYYPVDVDTNLSISSATITFNNQEIESAESSAQGRTENKKTSAQTQHMTMHAGLIRNFMADSNEPGSSRNLNVSTLTMKGSVGMMSTGDGNGRYSNNACSGALICGDAYGSQTSAGERNTCSVSINGLTLGGVKVYNYAESYAPLLINAMGSYVALSLKDVNTQGYEKDERGKTKVVATSLIGNLGGSDETQVTATFEDIGLPSKTGDKGDAIFSKASLLHSFAYSTGAHGAGSAMYTFFNPSGTAAEKSNKITYGVEIDRSGTEYSGKQLWYFDEDTYGTDDGLVVLPETDKKANEEDPVFGGYLPYVYVGKADGQDWNHEIKVNQRLEDLTTGCGTYTDPYEISKESTLVTLASYVNDAKATDGWKVTIAKDQTQGCNRRHSATSPDTSNEVTYTYNQNGNVWRAVGSSESPELSNETMHHYLQGCYIDILDENQDASLHELVVHTSKFDGLGSKEYPFRGVITSTNNSKLVINHDAGSFSGLIKYSYGCVIKNLAIEYAGSENDVAYYDKDTAHAAPGSFFGGVFGNILGGDNIIDGVSVSKSGEFSVIAKDKADNAGTARLVPIGGYVGTITGGGVIFRGIMNPSWYEGSKDDYYNNPVIGRVLDGYAFIEGDACNVGSNTIAGKTYCNYKLVKLDTNKTGNNASITTGDLHNSRVNNNSDKEATKTTVSDAQGLLVLSAIINSGAAAGPVAGIKIQGWNSWAGYYSGTNAYSGASVEAKNGYSFGNAKYGKVRNATYDYIGQTGQDSSADFSASVADDTRAPGITTSDTYPHSFSDNQWSQVNAPYLVTKYCSNKKTMYICAAGYNSMDLQLGSASDEAAFDMKGYGNAYRGLSAVYYTNALIDSSRSGATYSRDRGIPWIAHIGGNNSTLKVDLNVCEYNNDDFNVVGVGALFSYAMFTQFNIDATPDDYQGKYIQDLTISDSTIQHQGGKVYSAKKTDANCGVGGIAGVVTAENSMNVKDLVVSNVKIQSETTTTVSGPATAGGFFGNAGIYKRVAISGTASESTIPTPISASSAMANAANVAFSFADCSYSNLSLTGGSHAGGFVGQINSSVGLKTNTVSGSGNIGSSSSVSTTSSSATGAMGGVFGYVNAPVNISGTESGKAGITEVNIKNSSNIDGAGGLVGKVSGKVELSHVLVQGANANSKMEIGSENRWNAGRFAGGLLGNVTSRAVTINDAEVSNIKLISPEGDGGVVAQLANGASLTADLVKVSNVEVGGSCSGGFTGVVSAAGSSISISNTEFNGISLSKKSVISPGWAKGNVSGVVTGDARGTFALNNILIDSCTFDDVLHQGILAGNAATDSNLKGFYVSGLEIRGDASRYPSRYFCVGNTGGNEDELAKKVNKKAFVSFSNYDGSAAEKSSDHELLGSVSQKSPWVTTSPSSDTRVEDGYLFGDGPNVDVASRIVNKESKTDSNAYAYSNTVGHDSNGAWQDNNAFRDSYVSTYGDNNDLPNGMKNFKVLQVGGGETGIVESYLNAITNGGFADAASLNSGDKVYVKAKAEVYKFEGKTFVKDETLTPNVSVGSNGTSFNVSSSYDNGKGQFTLLTITFSANGSAASASPKMTHTVVVPVIVRRQLENTFTATLNYGTNFTESAYADRGADTRLLESFGNASTALLTFSYNKSDGGTGTYDQQTEYGWDSYLAAGGSMGPVDKIINFDNSVGQTFPKGTQLTLVDKGNGDHTYTYTLESPSNSLSLSAFKDTESADSTYSPKWMSELMGVTATKTDDKSGAWVQLPSAEGATARAKNGSDWHYYRPANGNEPGDRYTLTCAKEDGKELSPSENFYLVITIPESDDSQAINGSIKASVACEGVKVGDTKNILRTDKTADNNSNTASTYNFVSSYNQTLMDQSSDREPQDNPKAKIPDDPESGSGKILHMGVVDEISAGGSQLYTVNDPLFYRLSTSLEKFDNGNSLGTMGFPTGSDGTAKFYVYTMKNGERVYWETNDGGETWSKAKGETSAYEISWLSNGSAMDLDLACDLADIRQEVINGGSFCVETKMDIHLSPEAYNAAIMASQDNGENTYTKLNYRASLADSLQGLRSSSTVASPEGNPLRYYREDTGVATISLTADHPEQLGINLDDLSSKSDGIIDPVTAVYDLTALSNADDLIAKADKVVYALTLERRSGTDGTYEKVGDISDYLSVTSGELGQGSADGQTGSITWTDNSKNTKDEESNKFKLTLRFNIDTTLDAHKYANYRLRLTAKLYQGDNVLNEPWNKNKVNGDNDDFNSAHSDYVTYTLTRVKLDGIERSTSGS